LLQTADYAHNPANAVRIIFPSRSRCLSRTW